MAIVTVSTLFLVILIVIILHKPAKKQENESSPENWMQGWDE
jgi:hypothetical protein